MEFNKGYLPHTDILYSFGTIYHQDNNNRCTGQIEGVE